MEKEQRGRTGYSKDKEIAKYIKISDMQQQLIRLYEVKNKICLIK